MAAFGGRFVLLVYSVSGPAETAERHLEESRGAWLALLKSLRKRP